MRSDWTFPKSTIFCSLNCDSLLWKGFWLFAGQGVLGNCGAYAITLINPINKIFNQRIRDSYAKSRCSQRFAYFSRILPSPTPGKYLNGAICVLTWKKYIAFSYHKYHNHVYILPSKHMYSIGQFKHTCYLSYKFL